MEDKTMELLTIEETNEYMNLGYQRKQRIREACQNKINVCGVTKPAYVQLRAGGTIARIVWYVDRVKHYTYGNVVLRDVQLGTKKPTFYIYEHNRLIRIDTEHKDRSSYKVHQFVPMMEYCIYERGDKAIAEYDKIRLDKYKNYVTNLK